MTDRVLVDATKLHAGRLDPPVSKSDAQRALTLAYALRDTSLVGLPASTDDLPADVQVLRRGLESLYSPGAAGATIDCGDGGAPFRILLGQAAVQPGAWVRFVGTPRLGERPHQALFEALRRALPGLEIVTGDPWPVAVRAAPIRDALHFVVGSEVSSQFATSLVLAAATIVARTQTPVSVTVRGPIASAGYLDLTLSWLSRMGFSWIREPNGALRVLSVRAPSVAPPIPGDWSAIAQLLLIAWASGGSVSHVDLAAAHPDRAVLAVLAEAGLTVDLRDPMHVSVRGAASSGVRASGQDCPDLLVALAALACVLPGPSTLDAVSILRHKESDRLDAIEALVRAAGSRSLRRGEQLIIEPGRVPPRWSMQSRGDHRVAMASALLAVLARSTLVLDGAACVRKSFPGFWRALLAVGVRSDAMLEGGACTER